jgi:glycosyltransferase involved in cell wall biosynthesis
VSDFRDAWTRLDRKGEAEGLREFLERPLEARVIRASSAVLCNTPGMVGAFHRRYPEPGARRPHLPNGYDPTDFPPEAPCRTGLCPPAGPADRPLEVVYAGAFYGDYNPLAFLRGAGLALRRGLLPPGGVRVRLYGAHDRAVGEAIERTAEREGIGGMLERPGYVSHRRAIRALMDADLLLLVLPPGPAAAARITAKTYEMLAAGRPILAMVPEGDARDLLEASGAALAVLATDDVEGAARALGEARSGLLEGSLRASTRWDVARRFERRRIAAELAGVLDAVAGSVS